MNPIARMMKRYIKTPLKYALPLLFIGALVLVSVSGCVSQNTSSPSASSAPTAAPTATPTTNPNVDEGMEFHVSMTPDQPQALGSNGLFTPQPGNIFVAFNCIVMNVNAPTDSNTHIGLTYWQLRDNSGNVYDAYLFASGTPGIVAFKSVDSQPGDNVNGLVFFEVPANHGDWKSLTYNDGSRDVIISPL